MLFSYELLWLSICCGSRPFGSLQTIIDGLFLGGSFPFIIGRVEHGFNVRPDLCAVNNKINPKYVSEGRLSVRAYS